MLSLPTDMSLAGLVARIGATKDRNLPGRGRGRSLVVPTPTGLLL